MNEDVLNFIKEERDISSYKLMLLKKGSKKNYKHRLISIEKDFANYPFEELSFQSIDQAREAIELFRADRSEFLRRFGNRESSEEKYASDFQRLSLLNKINHLYEVYRDILDRRVKEVNLVQNAYIKNKFLKSNKSIPSEGIDSILQAEGAHLAKERARIQIMMYCLARYLYHRVKDIESEISEAPLSISAYQALRRRLDNIFEGIDRGLYKHYNDAIIEVPLLVNGTLGHNNFIHTIYPLKNLATDNQLAAERLLSLDKCFFDKKLNPIDKKFVKRGFGIVTNTCRVGNESIGLLYLELETDSGIVVTDLFEHEFFAFKAQSGYRKAISMKPVWEVAKQIDNNFALREVLGLFGLSSMKLVDSIDLGDRAVLNKINNSAGNRMLMNPDSSKILVAATRSEAAHIRGSYNIIKLLIKEIKNDYNNVFKPSSCDDKGRAARKNRVKEIKDRGI